MAVLQDAALLSAFFISDTPEVTNLTKIKSVSVFQNQRNFFQFQCVEFEWGIKQINSFQNKNHISNSTPFLQIRQFHREHPLISKLTKEIASMVDTEGRGPWQRELMQNANNPQLQMVRS